jgi:hypothetical protein
MRLCLTLDGPHAAKLSRLATRAQTDEETLAGSLLAYALDKTDPDARHAVDLLDGIPGSYVRALAGRTQAAAGKTVPLDDL